MFFIREGYFFQHIYNKWQFILRGWEKKKQPFHCFGLILVPRNRAPQCSNQYFASMIIPYSPLFSSL